MAQLAERTKRHKAPEHHGGQHDVSKPSRLPISPLAMRAVQPKLTVNTPGDSFEQEADAVAGRVMRSSPAVAPSLQSSSGGALQRSTPEEEDSIQRSTKEDEEPVQRQTEEEDEKPIQRKGVGQPTVSPATAATIRSPGAGSPLPSSVRSRVEPHVGANLSGVRVHTGPSAHRAAASLNARAFTHGSNIFLNRAESSSNVGLMAHEATHVVQQGAAPIQRQILTAPINHHTIQAKCAACDGKDISDIQRQEETEESPIQTLSIQRQTEATGLVQPLAAIQREEDTLTEFSWTLLEAVAPTALVELLRQINAQGGIIPYLTQLMRGAIDRLFEGLGDRSEFLNGIIEQFNGFLTSAQEMLTALSQGDCEPLLHAVEQMQQDLQEMANDAWQAVVDFFQPVGEFFSGLWSSFGAPVVDWITEVAGDIWQEIQDIANDIWEWTAPVREEFTSTWEWVKEQIGITGSQDSEDGLIDWIQAKAGEAWASLQEILEPVLTPIRQVYEQILEILPLDAIVNLRETLQEWLDSAGSMVNAMEEEDGVTEQQGSLREIILPTILRTITSVRNSLIQAGSWVVAQIGGLVERFTLLVGAVRANDLISHLANTLQWIETGAIRLAQWARSTVIQLFNTLDYGLVRLSIFVEPVLNTLEKLVSVVSDAVGNLSDLILGATWRRIPACIREPIQNFITEHILSHIPIFGQLIQNPEVWTRMQATAMRILHQVFVSGDLLRAAWNLFSSLLEILGIPPELVTNILSRAVSAFSSILNDPIGFLLNLLQAVKQGFLQFFGNIGSHLFSGISGWLFGQLHGIGITPPTDTSFSSIFRLTVQVLGISAESFFRSLQRHLGRRRVDQLRRVLNTLTGVWGWLSTLVQEGPAGLWQQFQEYLGNLWETLRDNVIGWLRQTVIVQATARLLTMLDPTGIMAVVNSLVSIYQAIQSFAENFRGLLEILNSVLEGINEIAEGVVTRGANILESSLVRALPIAISFLANQARVRNVGRHIREAIGRIQRRVQQAIDRLVDRAWRAGRNLLERLLRVGRETVARVAEWWRNIRHSFYDASEGETHSLYLERTGERLTPMINSRPRSVEEFVNDYQPSPNDPDKAQKDAAHQEARRLLQVYRGRSFPLDSPLRDDVRRNFDDLATQLTVMTRGHNATEGLHTGDTRSDAIPIYWYKPKDDYPDVVTISINDQPVDVSINGRYEVYFQGQIYSLGVNRDNFVDVGDTRLKTANYVRPPSTPESRKFREILRERGYQNLGIEDIDHVLDLAWDGRDRFDNLWPLNRYVNRAALQWYPTYLIQFKTEDNQVMIRPIGQLDGKWFRIIGFDSYNPPNPGGRE